MFYVQKYRKLNIWNYCIFPVIASLKTSETDCRVYYTFFPNDRSEPHTTFDCSLTSNPCEGATHFNKIVIIGWPIWDRCPYFSDLILNIWRIEYGSLCWKIHKCISSWVNVVLSKETIRFIRVAKNFQHSFVIVHWTLYLFKVFYQ